MAVTAKDLDLMAWTLLGEAAGEGSKGMQAVANVIVNRANSGQYPSRISKVVLQPKQFSAWNTGEGGNDPQSRYSKKSEAFKNARIIAEQAVNGELPDITGGALNYWAPRGMKNGADPYWAKGVPEDQRLAIGNHVFLPREPVAVSPVAPATMSPELAYVRGLSNSPAALEAINQATGAAPISGLDAYMSQNPAATASPANAAEPATNWQEFYSSLGVAPPKTDTSAFAPKEQALPPSDMYFGVDLAAARDAVARAQQPVPSFASDNAMKRLAAAKDPNSGLFTGNISAGPYNPQATMAAMAGQKAQAAPRITLADVMNGMPANNAPAPIRTAGLAGSNTEPLPGRPASLGPAPKQDPLLAWAAGNQAAPRAVTNLVTPTGASIPPNTGVGFGQTPVGSIQPAPFINPAIAAPKPATQSAAPTVNSKGFFLGNPVGDYAVKSGETLGKIAKKFGTTVDNLAAVNNIPDPAKVKAGARLVVTNPSVAPVTPAARINRPSTSSSSSTPVSTYRPATTSQPVSISNPVIKAPVVKPVATAPKPTYTLGQLMGTSFASGGYIPGGTNVPVPGPQYSQDAQRMAAALKTVDVASRVIPYVSSANLIASSFAPKETWEAKGAIANQLALAGTAAARNKSSSSTPMMDGSPSSSSRNTSGSRKDDNDGAKGGGSSSSGSNGGIDGVIGTYNPPTQAQIDAMYAPYFKPAVMPPAGYNPGVSGEFNYFPGSGPTAPVSNPMIQGTTPPAATAGAADWYNKFVNSMKSNKDRQAAKKVMAKDNTSYYDLFRQYQETLGRKASPTLEGWQSWLTTKGFATGGAVSEPRLVLGKGGPTADKIPAKIDGVHEARLSNGEFVMTAAAVRGLGGGDYHRGAEALMKLNDQFAPRQDKGTLKVEKVR